ncbi:hypothetical protein RZS08_58860, partial [Arthrospira platensis SPKY1]|nr:hypothetical protein [Arthrospira platensis SPKY1]
RLRRRRRLPVPEGRRRGEQVHRLRHRLAGHLLQRRHVEHLDGAAVRARNELTVAQVHLQVVHGDDGQVAVEAEPAGPAVERRGHAELGADVEQVRVDRVLAHHVHA